MTPLCRLCHNEPALPRRGIGANCRRAQRREQALTNAKAHRASPAPMTWKEFEEQQEAGEPRKRVREVMEL